MIGAYGSIDELPRDLLHHQLEEMPLPRSFLVCRPTYFQVVDVKNAFMQDQVGQVNTADASRQWQYLRYTFEKLGVHVQEIEAVKDREDMVFCANQTFVGLDAHGKRICVPSHMKHPSRRLEVPAFERWFKTHGYEIKPLTAAAFFEGSGDAIWHPGRRLIWGGVGERTQKIVYPDVAAIYGTSVITLKVNLAPFYHLDTCFCALDERTVLICSSAFDEPGLALIHHFFERVIDVPKEEAIHQMACNATAFLGKHVVIQKGAAATFEKLQSLGYDVHEVDTSEFMKSGGSVFCLKMYVF